jgi:hypothetical protein
MWGGRQQPRTAVEVAAYVFLRSSRATSTSASKGYRRDPDLRGTRRCRSACHLTVMPRFLDRTQGLLEAAAEHNKVPVAGVVGLERWQRRLDRFGESRVPAHAISSCDAMEAVQPVVDCSMSWRSDHATTVNLAIVGGWSGEHGGVWRTVELATEFIGQAPYVRFNCKHRTAEHRSEQKKKSDVRLEYFSHRYLQLASYCCWYKGTTTPRGTSSPHCYC